MKNPNYKPYLNCIEVLNYMSDKDTMALRCHANNKDDYDYITVTTNLPIDGLIMMPYCSFVDVNNNPGITEFLEKEGIAEPVMMNESGEPDVNGTIPMVAEGQWVTYPMYKFHKSKLIELGAIGLAEYEKTYIDGIATGRPDIFKQTIKERIRALASMVFPDEDMSTFGDCSSSGLPRKDKSGVNREPGDEKVVFMTLDGDALEK